MERQTGLRLGTMGLSLFVAGILASIFLVVFLNAPSHLTLPSKVSLQTETGSFDKERSKFSETESLTKAESSTFSTSETTEAPGYQSPSTTTSSTLSKSEEQKEAIDAANRYANQVAQSIASSERQAGTTVHFSQKR